MSEPLRRLRQADDVCDGSEATQEARESLERLTNQLSTMANWRDQLQVEINNSYALLDSEQFDALTKRVRLFSEVADTLCDMLGRRG
jgi:hypothetical protein